MTFPAADEVQDDLGDKVMRSLSSIIARTAVDLEDFRDSNPSLVARLSSRGLANVVHDMMRGHARVAFDDMGHVTLTDRDQYFQIQVTTPTGSIYLIRLKRHKMSGAIAAYPTQGALEFHSQPDDLLSAVGMRVVHLCGGYAWDPTTKTILGAVLSLRAGLHDDVIWMVDLPAPADEQGGTVAPIVPPKDGPSLPRIDIASADSTSSDIEGTATE